MDHVTVYVSPMTVSLVLDLLRPLLLLPFLCCSSPLLCYSTHPPATQPFKPLLKPFPCCPPFTLWCQAGCSRQTSGHACTRSRTTTTTRCGTVWGLGKFGTRQPCAAGQLLNAWAVQDAGLLLQDVQVRIASGAGVPPRPPVATRPSFSPPLSCSRHTGGGIFYPPPGCLSLPPPPPPPPARHCALSSPLSGATCYAGVVTSFLFPAHQGHV